MMRFFIFGVLISIGSFSWGQIKELDAAGEMKICNKTEYSTIEAFGTSYVALLNAEFDKEIVKLLASEKLIKKTARKKAKNSEIKDQFKKEVKGDFDQRIIAENLKLLKKLKANAPQTELQFESIHLNTDKGSKEKLGFTVTSAEIIVKAGESTYTIKVGRVIETVKGWRILQLTDYFARVEVVVLHEEN